MKIKCLKDEDFVVCGYVPKAENGNVASVILGTYQDGRLVDQGHVALGVSRNEFELIKGQTRTNPPFEHAVSGAVYIEPSLVCTVKYMERSPGGGLRQPEFKGLRMDKELKDVKKEFGEFKLFRVLAQACMGASERAWAVLIMITRSLMPSRFPLLLLHRCSLKAVRHST